MRQRGAQLGDPLQPLGTKPQGVDPFLIGDVLEDGRRRSVEVPCFAIGVCGGHADREAPHDSRDQALGARRPDLMFHGSLERLGELWCHLADLRENRLADVLAKAFA